MRKLKRAKWLSLLLFALMTALGIVLLIWPGVSLRVLCTLLGVLVLLFGAVKLFSYFCEDRFDLAFQCDFALGLFAVVAGLLMVARPGSVVAALHILLGVYILVDGAFKLQTALDARRFGLNRWWSVLLLALLTCACGLLLVLSPFDGARALTRLLGLALVVDGVQNFGVIIYTVRPGRLERRR